MSVTEVLVASVPPLTRARAIYLDKRAHARDLPAVLTLAGTTSDRRHVTTYPTTSELLRSSKGRRVSGLASPDAAPPKGYTGYWSAGGTRAVVATLSAAGRRLYIDVDAEDQRFSSNVTEYLGGE